MESFLGPDGQVRCGWAAGAPGFLSYHDTEWGFPVADDIRLFEKLCLEGFQSGLSWRMILAKQDSFRAAFACFDFRVVADYTCQDVERLLQDPGIVRHRGKTEAVISNAGRAVELAQQEGSLAAYVWAFEPGRPAVPQAASASPESTAMSTDLKKRGWRFVGPTTVFAFMQAMGLVNDHAHECWARAEAARARATFTSPASDDHQR